MRLGARFFSTIRLLVRGERVLTPKPEWELCLFELLLDCDNITEKSGVVLFEHAKLTQTIFASLFTLMDCERHFAATSGCPQPTVATGNLPKEVPRGLNGYPRG